MNAGRRANECRWNQIPRRSRRNETYSTAGRVVSGGAGCGRLGQGREGLDGEGRVAVGVRARAKATSKRGASLLRQGDWHYWNRGSRPLSHCYLIAPQQRGLTDGNLHLKRSCVCWACSSEACDTYSCRHPVANPTPCYDARISSRRGQGVGPIRFTPIAASLQTATLTSGSKHAGLVSRRDPIIIYCLTHPRPERSILGLDFCDGENVFAASLLVSWFAI